MPGSRVRFPSFPFSERRTQADLIDADCGRTPASRPAVRVWHPAAMSFGTRGRRWLAGAIAAALVASLAAFLRPTLERAVRERIESSAVRHGMVCRIGSVHVGAWPFLRLEGVDLD